MAAVTKVAVKPILVADAKIGKAAANLVVGDPVVIDAAAAEDPRYPCTYKKAASETHIHGVVLKDCIAAGPVEVMTEGEFDGYSGLSRGTPLSVATGNIDSAAPGAGFPIQLVALNTTRIWVKC